MQPDRNWGRVGGVLHLAVSTAGQGLRLGLIATAFGFGFRHGIDWDHIAALTDITSSQDESRRSMFFATLYALGHALVVFTLGFFAIVLSEQLPDSVDAFMEHVVGLTLIVLGVYVFYALLRHGRAFRMRSRWMLVFSGVRRGALWLRGRRATADEALIEHDHTHPAGEPHVLEPSEDRERELVTAGRMGSRLPE